jgi:hypothetical protein
MGSNTLQIFLCAKKNVIYTMNFESKVLRTTFFLLLVFEFRASPLLAARQTLYNLSHNSSPFYFSYFFKWGLALFALAILRLKSSYLCLQHSWDYSSIPLHPAKDHILFYFYHIIVVPGLHCEIYKSAYNVS